MSDILINKLCKRWRTAKPEIAMAKAVDFYFPELKHAEPPIDLECIAHKRNIVEIKRAQMTHDGIISLISKGSYLVNLNDSHSEHRQRFTLAHEIGHTFFFELEDGDAVRSRLSIEDKGLESLGANQYEEFLCNMAATDILMPYSSFHAKMNLTGISARGVRMLSRSFNTSLQATARRVTEIIRPKGTKTTPPNLTIALWKYQPDTETFHTVWVERSPRNQSSQQFVVDRKTPIFKTFQSSTQFRGKKWIALGGPIEDYFIDGIELNRSGSKCILTVCVHEDSPEKYFTEDSSTVIAAQQPRLF